MVQDQKSTTLRKLVEVTKWIMSASSVQPVEAGVVAESESLLGTVLRDLLLPILLLVLDAAAAEFAIGIDRLPLLLHIMALCVKHFLFLLVSRQASCCAPHRRSAVAAGPADSAAADALTDH